VSRRQGDVLASYNRRNRCDQDGSSKHVSHNCKPPAVVAGEYHLTDAASRGGDERAIHLRFDALNGASPNAKLASDFQNALAGPQLSLDSFFQRLIDLRAAELLALFYGPPISAQMRSSGLFVAMWFDEQIN
jgi:hypothetical protein